MVSSAPFCGAAFLSPSPLSFVAVLLCHPSSFVWCCFPPPDFICRRVLYNFLFQFLLNILGHFGGQPRSVCSWMVLFLSAISLVGGGAFLSLFWMLVFLVQKIMSLLKICVIFMMMMLKVITIFIVICIIV